MSFCVANVKEMCRSNMCSSCKNFGDSIALEKEKGFTWSCHTEKVLKEKEFRI